MNEDGLLPDGDSVSAPSDVTVKGRAAPRGERLRAGDVLLGRYTVLSELGEGGMGVVYRCFDRVGGIEVAVKCLPPELSRNEGEMAEIRENYGLVAKLHHSAISGLRQLERDPDTGEYYLVMDLAEGEDLSQVLRRRRHAPMPPPEALAILRPLAAALDYAHAEKVLHRDVKPANVKVSFGPGGAGRPAVSRVQLLDFGLAAEVRSSLSRVSGRGHLGSSGTPAYMAPEQWEALKLRQGPATDQYALAVVAYQMLAGVCPFDADDPDVLRRAVLSCDPDPVPGLSHGSNAALRRALAKDPGQRFPSCTAFVEALRTGRDGSTGRPRRLALAATLGALAVLGALWFALVRGDNPGDTGKPGNIGGIPDIPGISDIDSPSPDPHAESAELDPHAESAESAEPSGRARSPGAPPAPSSPSVPVLPPKGASIEDLQSARTAFANALNARRAEDWPDSTAESASLLSSISSLDDRIAAALEAQEKAERDEEAARLAKLEEDAKSTARAAVKAAKDEEAIRVLRSGAARDAKKAEPFRKWAGEGEFKARFEALDGRKKELDGCSKAADLARAQGAAADVRVAADWIADNAPAREELDGIERDIDALSSELADPELSRYAKSALYRAKTTRDEAAGLRDRSEFAKAKARLGSAKAQYEAALASAKAARAAAKAKEALVDAAAAKIREDWASVLAAAEKALEWEPGNADAKALKAEAENGLSPVWAVSATLPDGSVATGATLAIAGKAHTLPVRLKLTDGKAYGPGEITLEKDGKDYVGTLARTTVDWKGERPAVVRLEERKVPRPGEVVSLDLGSGVKLEMVHCPGVEPGFWMGKYEVTQEQWQRVMGTNPSEFQNKPKNPVENVSWNDCQKFIRKFNGLPAAKAHGLTFRLPTEEEWRVACRAGAPKSESYCRLGDGTQVTAANLARVAWFGKIWDDGPTEAGKNRVPNAWGLYDMHGNVWEWTQTDDGRYRMYLGGSFNSSAVDCRTDYRSSSDPDNRYRSLGFRLAASARAATASAAAATGLLGKNLSSWGFTAKAIDPIDNPQLSFYAPDGGLFVFATSWGGNAERAGIKENDILREVDGKPVETLDDIAAIYDDAMARLDEKTKVVIVVERRGRRIPLSLNYFEDLEEEIIE